MWWIFASELATLIVAVSVPTVPAVLTPVPQKPGAARSGSAVYSAGVVVTTPWHLTHVALAVFVPHVPEFPPWQSVALQVPLAVATVF